LKERIKLVYASDTRLGITGKVTETMNVSSHPTLDLSDVFAYVDAHRQAFLERLIDYVRRPSISAYGEGIDAVADYIAGVMRQVGLVVRIMPTNG